MIAREPPDLPSPTRGTFSNAGNSLLDYATAEIGVNNPAIGQLGSLPKVQITDKRLAGEARKRLGLVDGQSRQTI